MLTQTEPHFEQFFRDPLYLLYKNHLYNYIVRRYVIRKHFKIKSFKSTLEVGCGISPVLKPTAQVVQTDLSWQALSFTKKTTADPGNFSPITCDATCLPFIDESFDCVICSEVIEHIEQDQRVLDEINRVLEPGGRLFLTCPVRPECFGFDDQFVGHYRRYQVPTLIERLSKTGFNSFQVIHVLGPLEKQIMEKVTRLFAKMGKYKDRGMAPKGLGKFFALIGFPFYLMINTLLAFVVYNQACRLPTNQVMNVCIQCEKIH